MHINQTAHIIINNPSHETISAGLGNAYQYGFVLLAMIIVGIILWLKKKRKNRKVDQDPNEKADQDLNIKINNVNENY